VADEPRSKFARHTDRRRSQEGAREKYLADVRNYIAGHLSKANETLADLENFFRDEVAPFIRKIQSSAAIKDPTVGELLNPIKSQVNKPNQLREAIKRAQIVSDDQLLKWRGNFNGAWKPFVDSQIVDKFKIGAVEKNVRDKMGELESYLSRLADQKRMQSAGTPELSVLNSVRK